MRHIRPSLQRINAASNACVASDLVGDADVSGMQSALVAALTADLDAKTRTAAAAGLGVVGSHSAEHCKAAVDAGQAPSCCGLHHCPPPPIC